MADSQNSDAITCQALTRQATDFIENRLPAASQAAIERHLLSCNACKTYIEQLRLVRDSLGKLPGAQDVQKHDPKRDPKRNALTEHFVRTMRDDKKP